MAQEWSCPHCGKKNPAALSECGWCRFAPVGLEVPSAPASVPLAASPAAKKPRDWTWGLIAVALLVFVPLACQELGITQAKQAQTQADRNGGLLPALEHAAIGNTLYAGEPPRPVDLGVITGIDILGYDLRYPSGKQGRVELRTVRNNPTLYWVRKP